MFLEASSKADNGRLCCKSINISTIKIKVSGLTLRGCDQDLVYWAFTDQQF